MDQEVTVIERRSRLRMLDLREVWSYRELLWNFMARDIKVRYRHATLGIAWAVLRPGVNMVIFALVFGRLAKIPTDHVPYPVFVLSGLLPWMYFAQAIGGASSSVLGASALITKVYFPRLIIPLAAFGVAVVDFAIATVLMLPLAVWYHILPGWSLIALPVVVVTLTVAALGIGVLLSALTVNYRDFRHIEPFLMQVWMFLTPIVYPSALIPERWRAYAYLNPATGAIEAFRACWTGSPIFWPGLGMSLLIGLGFLTLGVLYFERVERDFADVI